MGEMVKESGYIDKQYIDKQDVINAINEHYYFYQQNRKNRDLETIRKELIEIIEMYPVAINDTTKYIKGLEREIVDLRQSLRELRRQLDIVHLIFGDR